MRSDYGVLSPFFSQAKDALEYCRQKIFQPPVWESLQKRFDALMSQEEIVRETIYQTDVEIYIIQEEVWSSYNEFEYEDTH